MISSHTKLIAVAKRTTKNAVALATTALLGGGRAAPEWVATVWEQCDHLGVAAQSRRRAMKARGRHRWSIPSPTALVGAALLTAVWASSAQAQMGPYGETMYLRGEMNGWGLANPMEYVGMDSTGQHLYEVTVDLAVGYLAFKIANEHWNLNFAADGQQRTEIPLNQTTMLEDASGSNNENIIPVGELSGYKFTLFVDAGNLGHPSLLIETAPLQGPPPEPLPSNPDDSLTWRDETAALTIDDVNAENRTYSLHTTVALRDNEPPTRKRVYAEQPGQMTLRSGSLLFDSLFALAIEESRQLSVDAITDGSFNNNQPVDLKGFETGAKWHYVWTRDTAYATDLAMGLLDPERAMNSLLFKLSERRVSPNPAGPVQAGPEIVQDTGSGGSWPISTDRVTWALGAWKVLQYLHGEERQSFRDQAYDAIVTTIENDRKAIYDPSDGLYRGEQSYLDWREQTYPRWMATEVVHIGMSKALSTNVVHYAILDIAAALAEEKGDHEARNKYRGWADKLSKDIDRAFWLKNVGLYSTMKTTELDPVAVEKYDFLGESLAILKGIASPGKAASILENYPHSEAGPPVIWPQLPNIPIYHNRAIWPLVTAYSLRAAKVAKNDAVVDHNVTSLVRLAALNLSNMENFEFLSGQHTLLDGPYTGPVINSQRQLWSVAGYVSMVLDTLFGLESTQEAIRFQPFITRQLRNTLFANANTLTLKRFPYRGKTLTVEIKLPARDGQDGGYYKVAGAVLNGRSIRDSWIRERDLRAVDNRLVIQLAHQRDPNSRINVVQVADYKNLTEEEVRAIWAPHEPEIVSITKTQDGRLKLTLDSKGEQDVVFNIYRNGEPYASGVTTTEWIDPDSGAATMPGKIQSFTPDNGLISNASAPVNEHGRWHYAFWGNPTDELLTRPFRVDQSGKHYVQIVYGNALNSINTGITAATKWVEIRDRASGAIAGQGAVTMPHRTNWDDWGDSSLLPVSLQAGREYTVTIKDFYNMSYFAHFSIYTGGAGGSQGPVNNANIAEVKILPIQKMVCYSVESEFIGSGNTSHHSPPKLHTALTQTTAAGSPTLTVNDGSGSGTLTVNDGSGDGGYEAGATVTVTADPPAPGKEFTGWSGDTQILANPSEETTTATMPSIDVTITATYADAPSSEPSE